MVSFTMDIDTTFGIKADALVNGFTQVILAILTLKRDQWIQTLGIGKDFYASHPNNKSWNKDEKAKIDERDISKWDTSLCTKWLQEFNWGAGEKLSKAEMEALNELRNIRNNKSHKGPNETITEAEFDSNCKICEESLLALGTSTQTINAVIANARNKCLIEKDKLIGLIESNFDYETKDILGAGASAVVIHAKHKIDKLEYAIKVVPIKKCQLDDDKVVREVCILGQLSNLHHKNIVHYKTSSTFNFTPQRLEKILLWDKDNYESKKLTMPDVISSLYDPNNQYHGFIKGIYIVTELCGESLREWMDSDHPKGNVQWNNEICRDFIDGLTHVHCRGFIHRDLRPENIFFASRGFKFPIKIGDFGLSTEMETTQTMTRTSNVGHFLYRAPEMDKRPARYNYRIDLSALGLIISEIFDPVPQNDLMEKFNKIRYKKDTGEKIKALYPSVNEVILQLTFKKADYRKDLDSIKNVFAGSTTTTTIPDLVESVNRSLELQSCELPRGFENLRINENDAPFVVPDEEIAHLRNLLSEGGCWSANVLKTLLDLVEPGINHSITTIQMDLKKELYRMQRDQRNMLKLIAVVEKLG